MLVADGDPKLQEFLALMRPGNQKAIWTNDDVVHTAVGQGEGDAIGRDKDSVSEDELYESMDPVEPSHDHGVDALQRPRQEDKDRAREVMDATVSDLDYLRSKMTARFSDEDEEVETADAEDVVQQGTAQQEVDGMHHQVDAAPMIEDTSGDKGECEKGRSRWCHRPDDQDNTFSRPSPRPSDSAPDSSNPVEEIRRSCRLFARNLPFSATEEDLRQLFEQYGDVQEILLIHDKITKKSRGYALITFPSPEEAVSAFLSLDGTIFMGRLMHLLPGKPSHDDDDSDGNVNEGGGTSSYKREKESKERASALNKSAWNTLFMRADTVADAVADHYGISKADLLDPSASDMAVRLALGEIKVISVTKEYFEEHGVNTQVLESAALAASKRSKNSSKMFKDRRSDNVLIIKNLPYNTDEEELKNLFTGMGPVCRWLLPPSRAMALVEYISSADASKAFKTLAFKRYQSVPIYLEWAPRDIFLRRPPSSPKQHVYSGAAEMGIGEAKPPHREVPGQGATVVASITPSEESADSNTIFVKNLSFQTSTPGLIGHFKAAVVAAGGELKTAKVVQRKKGKNGPLVSAGYGFVECSSDAVARDAIRALQGSALDGHKLVLQLATSSSTNTSSPAPGAVNESKPSTKIVVRNVAFEATRKDIIELFNPFGEVKSCRLPKKLNGQHRGFAFVDFASKQEAKTAVSSVAGMHLYGRRLVIEWSVEEEGMDSIREKTARKFSNGSGLHMAKKPKSQQRT